MDKVTKRTASSIVIMALITLLLGLVLVIFPGAATKTICLILGWALLLGGVASIVYYLINRKNSSPIISLVVGIIAFGWGLWIVINPVFWVSFLFIIFGVLMVLHGLGNLGDGIEMKRCGFPKWWISLILGIVTILLGILVIILPFVAASTVVVFCGISLIFDALTDFLIVSKLTAVFGKKQETIEIQKK